MRAEPGRVEARQMLEQYPRLERGAAFPFVCAGCGDCCRQRKDLLLNGYDLYRLARRLSLPPRIVAQAFCAEEVGEENCLPSLRLKPGKDGNCPFLDGGGCAVHSARPLACALYPLGQCIDVDTGKAEYYVQTPLCGARAEGRTREQYLEDAGVLDRAAPDARWAVVCTEFSRLVQQAGGKEHPHFAAVMRRMCKGLYLDYSLHEDYYPQFCENVEVLRGLLPKMLR